MLEYEKFKIESIKNLKQPTVYFFLKNMKCAENYIKNLRNAPNSIKLNGEVVNIRAKISQNDVLEILKSPNKSTDIALCDGKLDILYEDDDYLIVNKPHNLSCTPNRSHFYDNLGGQVMKYMLEKDKNFVLRIVGRLDRETAGIVVIAKNVFAYNKIKLDKTYYALCEGNIESPFTIDKPILTVVKDGINEHKRIISKEGKPSITHVFPVKNYENTCLVKFKLETGRTHQIRLHMSSCGHPVVGDSIYGNAQEHAFLILKEIYFEHFRTKQQIDISVPFPDDWKI